MSVQKPGPKRKKITVKVPVGLEQVLYHAARDEEFRKKLLCDRQTAIAECGIALRPSEEATLKVIPNAALETMIANIVPENPRRRKFMGMVAAAAASLAAGTASNACGEAEPQQVGVDAGIDGDMNFEGGTDTESGDETDSDSSTEVDSGAGLDSGANEKTVELRVDAVSSEGATAPDDESDEDCDCNTIGAKR